MLCGYKEDRLYSFIPYVDAGFVHTGKGPGYDEPVSYTHLDVYKRQGGICTLIGTSTNLVVHGMILEAGFEGFSMFEMCIRDRSDMYMSIFKKVLGGE